MKENASALRFVVPILLGLFLLPTTAFAAPAAVNAYATLEYLGGEPGNQTYRFDYTLENLDVTPALAGFIVFFDSDGLNRADFVEYTYPDAWDDVFVFPEGPDGFWNVEWNEWYGTNRILPGESLSGFSVTFTWNDPTSIPNAQFFEGWNGEAYEGITTVIPGSSLQGCIEGTIVATCGGDTDPAAGVIVDLYSSDNTLIASGTTDLNGDYAFSGLALADYLLTIVTPIGFVADQETKPASVFLGGCSIVDFELTCLSITPAQRSMGYWKHQVNCHIRGKGKPHESLADMSYYMELIKIHFNDNLLNPVRLLEVDPDTDSLLALRQLLTVNKRGTMADRAKQQTIALLLNVVSQKISLAEIISADGANVSQAITYCEELITDGIATNNETAKDIADYINNGLTVPAGVIPLDTPVIWYERDNRGDIVYLGKGCPNPFSSSARIAFALKGDGLVPVDLKVFDVTGRVVRTLIDRDLHPGQHSVTWNGLTNSGTRVSSGVYFYELRTPVDVATGKLVVRR